MNYLFSSLVLILILFFSFLKTTTNQIFVETSLLVIPPKNNNFLYPNDYFSGYTVHLKPQELTNSTATAFSLSSKKGLWITSAHSVLNCKYILLDIDGEDWEIIDSVEIHPHSDLAVIHSSVSAPALSFVSNDTWVPKNLYNIGYSSNSLNSSWLTSKGWTISYDEDREIKFPILVWHPEIILDSSKIHGLSGSPIIDEDGFVYGVVSSVDNFGYLGAITSNDIQDILTHHNIKFDKINVVKQSNFVPDILSNMMSNYQKQGSIKRIQCIRNPDYKLKEYLESIDGEN